jgi:tetratricopeptide (TPR) repeat protein
MSRGTLAFLAAPFLLSSLDAVALPAGPSLRQAMELEERAEAAALAGRGDEAETFAARALVAREAVLGRDDTATAPAFGALGLAHAAAGRLDEALWALARAVELRTRALGARHPSLAVDLFHIAEAELRLGRLASAAERLARVRRLLDAKANPRGGDRRAVLAMFALVRAHQGLAAEAEALLQESLAAAAGDADAKVPVAAALAADRLAFDAWGRGERARAEQLYKRVVRLSEEALGPRDPEHAVSLLNLGAVLHHAGRLKNAEHLYRHALDIIEEAARPGDARLPIALERLATLCADLGRDREAERLQKRLARATGTKPPARPTPSLATLETAPPEIAALAAREGIDR